MRDMSRTKRDVGDAVPYCFRSSFSSMRVNSSGRGQCSSTGSPVRGMEEPQPRGVEALTGQPRHGLFAP